MDEIYDALFVNRTKDLGTALWAFDRTIIDGAGVNGVGWLTRLISRISALWDAWIVDGIVNLSAQDRVVCRIADAVYSDRSIFRVRAIYCGGRDRAVELLPAPDSHASALKARAEEMEFFHSHALSIILLTPLVGAIAALFVPGKYENFTACGATCGACSVWWWRCR